MADTQSGRVDDLERRLLTTEVARRKAVRDGDRKLHNDLASMNREAISEIEPKDLRSLVTRWMLQLGKAADQAQHADECPDGGPHLWIGRDGGPATGDDTDRCDVCNTRRSTVTRSSLSRCVASKHVPTTGAACSVCGAPGMQHEDDHPGTGAVA